LRPVSDAVLKGSARYSYVPKLPKTTNGNVLPMIHCDQRSAVTAEMFKDSYLTSPREPRIMSKPPKKK
jgi:hypothetical protein